MVALITEETIRKKSKDMPTQAVIVALPIVFLSYATRLLPHHKDTVTKNNALMHNSLAKGQ
jgi:hypothetical protein